MKESHRLQKVEKEIREVIASHLLQFYRSELDGLISVSRVSVTSDLRQARVYVTHIGNEAALYENIEVLNSHAAEIQHLLAKKLAMKFTPKLRFYFDETFYNSLSVETKLKELKEQGLLTPTSEITSQSGE